MKTYRQYMKEHKGKRSRIDLFWMTEAAIRVDAYTDLLDNLFKGCKGRIKNNNLDVSEICVLLNKKFKTFKIVFTPVDASSEYAGNYGVEDVYTNDDIFNSIDVFLNVECEEYFNLYDVSYISTLVDLLEHEIIHREQAVRMRSQEIIELEFAKGSGKGIEYYSNIHELMAYAFSIVEELRMKGYTNIAILNNLSTYTLDSPIFKKYLELFKPDSDVIKQLVKYIYSYVKD